MNAPSDKSVHIIFFILILPKKLFAIAFINLVKCACNLISVKLRKKTLNYYSEQIQEILRF